MVQLRSLRDAPDTKREYETIFILRAETTTDNIQEVNVRIRKVIEEKGGKVLRVDNWGKRKLAYEIRKQLKGIYLYWQYLGEAELVSEIERNLRMLDMVIRYYSVRVDQNVDPNARPSQMDEESFLAAATTIPDEEDNYMGRGYADEEFERGDGDEGASESAVLTDPAAEIEAEVPSEVGEGEAAQNAVPHLDEEEPKKSEE
jgi:small subunit ribosomal protein S6